MRILMIGNNVADIRLAEGMLRPSEMLGELTVATSGEQALAMLNHTSKPREALPDLILLDLDLPKMPAFQVLAALKSLPGLRAIPVVVLAGSEDESDILEAYNLHANAYLAKPSTPGESPRAAAQHGQILGADSHIAVRELHSSMHNWKALESVDVSVERELDFGVGGLGSTPPPTGQGCVHLEPRAAGAGRARADSTGRDESVLIVDDDGALREAVSDILGMAGYSTTARPDAELALSAMERNRPDLVLADIKMPVMDGYAFYQRVRQNPAWQAIPFIFMSAKAYETDIRRGYELGAEHYMTKPFDREQLLESVRCWLDKACATRQQAARGWESESQQFITVLGHELRTPLFAIQGYLSLAQQICAEGDSQGVERMLRGMQHGAERLGKCVEDLLMLADIDSGVAQADVRRFSRVCRLDGEVEGAVESLQPRAEQQNIKLIFEGRVESAVSGIPALPQMILRQLIDNAIKFSPREGGKVWVRMNTQNGSPSVRVQDQGMGIPQADRPNPFRRFKQIDREQHEQQGLGLGLYLARALARLHDGEITFARGPEGGSVFTRTMPAVPSALPRPQHVAALNAPD